MADSDNWIETTIQVASKKTSEEIKRAKPIENTLIKLLVDKCYAIFSVDKSIKFDRMLASVFDLLVAADYYSMMNHKGWFYCKGTVPRLFYNFTNCCPRHALVNEFYFNASNKLGSGRIGRSTSRLLRRFIAALIERNDRPEKILTGSEPVDAVIINQEQNKVFFAEIKASPLVTLPITSQSQKITNEMGDKLIEVDHAVTDNTNLFGNELSLFVPIKDKDSLWRESYFPLGQRKSIEDDLWGLRGVV